MYVRILCMCMYLVHMYNEWYKLVCTVCVYCVYMLFVCMCVYCFCMHISCMCVCVCMNMNVISFHFRDKSSTHNLKMDALAFFNVLFSHHSREVFYPHIPVIIPVRVCVCVCACPCVHMYVLYNCYSIDIIILLL